MCTQHCHNTTLQGVRASKAECVLSVHVELTNTAGFLSVKAYIIAHTVRMHLAREW